MASVRTRKLLLPNGARLRNQSIADLISSLDNKVDLHPIYQRDIRWTKEKMDALIGTVMENGIIPALLIYQLQAGDERKMPSIRWECIDGQHRLFVLSHFLRGRAVRLNGREWMISWKWLGEDKQETHVFFEKTDDTKRWIAAHPSGRFEYMTEEERDHFSEFSMELKEIHKDALTMEQRCAIFISLQQGVQVRNADLLKNYTSIRLIQFIQYEKKWENVFKQQLLCRCHMNPNNYWLHWVIRCFFILFPTAARADFKTRDTNIGKMIRDNDPLLNSTPEQEAVFSAAMERFFAFLSSLPAGVKFAPANFFALFFHLSDTEEGREDILRGHMRGWAADIPSAYKTAWENRKAAGDDDDEREGLYLQAVTDLERIKIAAEELPTRKSIPKKIRDKVWHNWFGEDECGYCYCCEEELSLKGWHCGHIVAAASGGKDTPDNLRPLCRTCNTSMGTQNMDEFKARYYPDE
jgi:hypothetical protein